MRTVIFKLMISIMLVMTIFSFQASAGCGRWVIRENTNVVDYLADPVFDAAFNDPAIDPSEKSNEVANANVESTNISQPLQEDKEIVDLSGKWQINMDKPTDYQKLILIQSDERLQGYLIDNITEVPATVTGSISENTVVLDAKLVSDGIPNRTDKKYKLDLAPSRVTMSGRYELYEANKLIRMGNATAIKALT